jgi:hypothetical protein
MALTEAELEQWDRTGAVTVHTPLMDDPQLLQASHLRPWSHSEMCRLIINFLLFHSWLMALAPYRI